MKKKTTGVLRYAAFASHIGISIVVAVGVGLFIGVGLDEYFHTSPYLTIFFLITGLISGFIDIWKTLKKELEADD